MSQTQSDPGAVAATVFDQFERTPDDFLSLLAELVAVDSGVDSPEGVAKVERIVADRLTRLPQATAEYRHEHGVDHVAITLPGADTRVALLGHADTVFPVGTVAQRPLRFEEGKCFGPGVADMKGGLAMATLVCEQLTKLSGHSTIDFVITGDEETRVVPPPFMDLIQRADVCLVLECGRPGRGFIVRRKGGFWVQVSAQGKSAHAGVQPERGQSAIVALCRAVIEIAEINQAREQLTVTVGTIRGGSAPNVVAAEALAEVDVRAFAGEDLDWALKEMQQIAQLNGVAVTELGDWPPMLQLDDTAETYMSVGQSLSIELQPQSTGGMSDGCWTAAAGIPTVDGTGPEGGDDHSPAEFIDIHSVPERAGILAGVVNATTQEGGTK